MSGEGQQALRAWTVVSLVLPLVNATRIWMMLMYVDDPAGVQLGPDLGQACSENRWSEYHGSQKLSVLGGLAGTRVFRVWDMAGRMVVVTAAGARWGS